MACCNRISTSRVCRTEREPATLAMPPKWRSIRAKGRSSSDQRAVAVAAYSPRKHRLRANGFCGGRGLARQHLLPVCACPAPDGSAGRPRGPRPALAERARARQPEPPVVAGGCALGSGRTLYRRMGGALVCLPRGSWSCRGFRLLCLPLGGGPLGFFGGLGAHRTHDRQSDGPAGLQGPVSSDELLRYSGCVSLRTGNAVRVGRPKGR
jgi:hypothetical protein